MVGAAVGANSPLGPSARPHPSQALCRSTTSRYTTAEQSTLDDFQCQICLGTLRSCVAIEPCGHNFCATCLSQYFGTQLESGVPHMCPLRCPDPERVVINETVRNLVETLEHSWRFKRVSNRDDGLLQDGEASGRVSGLAGAESLILFQVSHFLCSSTHDD